MVKVSEVEEGVLFSYRDQMRIGFRDRGNVVWLWGMESFDPVVEPAGNELVEPCPPGFSITISNE